MTNGGRLLIVGDFNFHYGDQRNRHLVQLHDLLYASCARNIGAYMESALNMRSHINNTIRASYAQLRAIAKLRKFLTIDAAKKIIHAFVTSHLDNLISLLINLPDYQIKKLQYIQNIAARLIAKLKKSDHITPTLINLHWPPISQRIEYKLLLLVFKCIIGKAPAYLCSHIQPYSPGRSLRSASQYQLQERSSRRKYGEPAFSVCAPRLWNQLPFSLRQ